MPFLIGILLKRLKKAKKIDKLLLQPLIKKEDEVLIEYLKT